MTLQNKRTFGCS